MPRLRLSDELLKNEQHQQEEQEQWMSEEEYIEYEGGYWGDEDSEEEDLTCHEEKWENEDFTVQLNKFMTDEEKTLNNMIAAQLESFQDEIEYEEDNE